MPAWLDEEDSKSLGMGGGLMSDLLGSLLELGLHAGKLLLESGAEVYRIEDTVERMLRSSGADRVESIVTPTGIFLSVHLGERIGTRIGRIHRRATNLHRVSAINGLSRALTPAGALPEEVLERLRQIERQTPAYAFPWQLLAATVGGTAFAGLFGASGLELPATAVASCLVFLLSAGLARPGLPRLLADFAGGATASLVALSLSQIVPTMHYDKVILGAIMSLVPGVLLTTAVRDMLNGDLLSGTTRLGEALFIAAAIAAGAGAVLGWWLRWMR